MAAENGPRRQRIWQVGDGDGKWIGFGWDGGGKVEEKDKKWDECKSWDFGFRNDLECDFLGMFFFWLDFQT